MTESVRDSRAEGLRIVRPMVRVRSLRSDKLVYLVHILDVAGILLLSRCVRQQASTTSCRDGGAVFECQGVRRPFGRRGWRCFACSREQPRSMPEYNPTRRRRLTRAQFDGRAHTRWRSELYCVSSFPFRLVRVFLPPRRRVEVLQANVPHA